MDAIDLLVTGKPDREVSKAAGVLEEVLDTRAAGYAARVRAATEVLKAVDLYGNVDPPDGPEDPELVLRQQAEQWARQEYQKRPPSGDILSDLITRDETIAELTRQRLEELKSQQHG